MLKKSLENKEKTRKGSYEEAASEKGVKKSPKSQSLEPKMLKSPWKIRKNEKEATRKLPTNSSK